MRRKRNIPWIHRRSRSIMAGIATVGAIITAYLTVVKLTEGTAACPTKGCDIVLASPYANLFGLPLVNITLQPLLGNRKLLLHNILNK